MGEQIDLSGYKLLLNEDFDSLRLLGQTDGFWKTSGYWGERTLSSNGERQLYVDPTYKDLGLNPFSVSDGVLTIRAEKASDELKPQIENLDYTSGLITSERSFAMQYGYFEIRAQMPEGKGLWPAFWMLSLDGEWPPELDVVEVLGHEPDKLYGTSHYDDASGNHIMDHAVASKGLFDSSDGFHTYGIDWQDDRIVWYYDGIKVGETENHTFDQPMYMLANLAVGGYWPGNPDAATAFPADMKIDYIRAYQKAVDHPVVGIPEDWEAIGLEAFTPLLRDGAKTVWSWEYSLASTETKAALSGDWARYLTGNDGDNYLSGSSASYNELLGGKGNDTLLGGKGTDVFVIRDGDGNDTILDPANVAGNTDKIRLEGFHFTHFDDVKPWLSQVGSDVILRLDQDQALLLKNTTIDALSPEMFVFSNSVAAPAGAPVLSPPEPAPIPTPTPTPEPVSDPAPAPIPDAPQEDTTAAPGGIAVGITQADTLLLQGYTAELNSAASDGTLIKASGSGTAKGTFSGADGSYKLEVGYLNETDGAAVWSVQVNGVTVGSWTGTGGSDAIETRSFDLNLKTGDQITLTGSQNVGEYARIDWLRIEEQSEPALPSIGLGTTQADSLSLTRYVKEQHAAANDGTLIMVNGSGTAQGAFAGADGSYKLSVGYVNENDGVAAWQVKVNGITVESWTGQGGDGGLEARSFNLDLKQGDQITLAGTSNIGEYARFDWLKVEKQMQPVAQTIDVGLTQADTLALNGYREELNAAASDGTLVKANGNGTAQGTFTGTDGSYELAVGFLNESDGEALWQLQVNGVTMGSWTGQGGSDTIETRNFGVDLKTGDQITLTGSQNLGEYARIDWLEVIRTPEMAGSQDISAFYLPAEDDLSWAVKPVDTAGLISLEEVHLVGVGLETMSSI